MSYSSYKPPCPQLEKRAGCLQSALDIIGDKWTPLLLGQLVESSKAFGELELALNGISPRTLSSRLEKLVKEDIVEKQRYNAHPPRFRYALTDKGQGLQEILIQMAEWGDKYHQSHAFVKANESP